MTSLSEMNKDRLHQLFNDINEIHKAEIAVKEEIVKAAKDYIALLESSAAKPVLQAAKESWESILKYHEV